MLNMAWVELTTLSAQINLLRGERAAAKERNHPLRFAELTNELSQAMTAREVLVARIGELLGEEAKLVEGPALKLVA